MEEQSRDEVLTSGEVVEADLPDDIDTLSNEEKK